MKSYIQTENWWKPEYPEPQKMTVQFLHEALADFDKQTIDRSGLWDPCDREAWEMFMGLVMVHKNTYMMNRNGGNVQMYQIQGESQIIEVKHKIHEKEFMEAVEKCLNILDQGYWMFFKKLQWDRMIHYNTFMPEIRTTLMYGLYMPT
jgi:hypothetical protein